MKPTRHGPSGRRLTLPCARQLSRPLGRRTTRPLGGRGPNHLAQALAALRQAVRAHRQLIKLDPEQFDQALRERLDREHAAEDRHDAEVAAAIARVYGTSEAEVAAEMHRMKMNSRGGNGAEMGRFSRLREPAIERWLAECELWLGAGREALERHHQHQPHRRLSLGTVARLLNLASVLGRLSSGCPLQC